MFQKSPMWWSLWKRLQCARGIRSRPLIKELQGLLLIKPSAHCAILPKSLTCDLPWIVLGPKTLCPSPLFPLPKVSPVKLHNCPEISFQKRAQIPGTDTWHHQTGAPNCTIPLCHWGKKDNLSSEPLQQMCPLHYSRDVAFRSRLTTMARVVQSKTMSAHVQQACSVQFRPTTSISECSEEGMNINDISVCISLSKYAIFSFKTFHGSWKKSSKVFRIIEWL